MKKMVVGLLGLSVVSSLVYSIVTSVVGLKHDVSKASQQKTESKKRGKQELLDLLIKDPAKALQSCDRVRNKFYREISKQGLDDKEDSKEYQAVLKEFEQKNPLFFLHECTDDYCVLDRYSRPKHRQVLEDEAVKTLVGKVRSSTQPLTYVSFASGGLFQDLVIITKALAQQPNASVVIHIIDNEYKCYTTCRDFIGGGREITSNYTVDPSIVMDQLKKHARKNVKAQDVPCITDSNFGKDTTEEDIYIGNTFDIEGDITSDCLSTEQAPKQLIAYLQATFPQATLSLHIHKSVTSYLKYIQQNKMSYPDVIITADIHNFQSALRAYKKLYMEALQHNQTVTSLWLTQWMWIGAQLHSMYTTEIPGVQKELFELQDGTFIAVYVKVTPIVDTAFKEQYEADPEFKVCWQSFWRPKGRRHPLG